MSTLGGHDVRGYRPGDFVVRNEREVFVDPEREAKILLYEQRAEAGMPLFNAQVAHTAKRPRVTKRPKRRK